MWFPAPFYVARIAEMRPALIVLATAHYDRNSVAGVVVGAIVLIFMSDRRDRSLSSAIVAVAQGGLLRRPVSVAIGPRLLFGPSIAEYRSLPALSRGLTLRHELMTTRL